MDIGTYTNLSSDTKKVLLQLVRNVTLAIQNGMIHDAQSLGIAAAHFREIASYFVENQDGFRFDDAQMNLPGGDELSDFLQQVPKSWKENPWPEILYPGSTIQLAGTEETPKAEAV